MHRGPDSSSAADAVQKLPVGLELDRVHDEAVAQQVQHRSLQLRKLPHRNAADPREEHAVGRDVVLDKFKGQGGAPLTENVKFPQPNWSCLSQHSCCYSGEETTKQKVRPRSKPASTTRRQTTRCGGAAVFPFWVHARPSVLRKWQCRSSVRRTWPDGFAGKAQPSAKCALILGVHGGNELPDPLCTTSFHRPTRRTTTTKNTHTKKSSIDTKVRRSRK